MAEARSAAGVEGAHAEGGEGYEGEAMAVVEAIAGDTARAAHPQRGQPLRPAVPRRRRRSSRCPASSGRAGAHPVAVGRRARPRPRARETVKAVERATIEAALTGSTALAVKALALHPLVPSVTTARQIFAGYRARLPELEERFAWA